MNGCTMNPRNYSSEPDWRPGTQTTQPDEIREFIDRLINERIELELITRIEAMEGRVPSNEEVKRFGLCLVGKDKTEYFWKGEKLITVMGDL